MSRRTKVERALQAVTQTLKENGFPSLGDFLASLGVESASCSELRAKISYLFTFTNDRASYFETMIKPWINKFSRAAESIDNILTERLPKLIANDLANIYSEKSFRLSSEDDQESILAFDLKFLAATIRSKAPFLSAILTAPSPSQIRHSTNDVKFESVHDVALLQVLQHMYLRCDHVDKLQMVVGFFLVSCGVPRDIYSLLNHLGICPSYQKCLNRMEALSNITLQQMKHVIIFFFFWHTCEARFCVTNSRS
jgi:hypothetical protein